MSWINRLFQSSKNAPRHKKEIKILEPPVLFKQTQAIISSVAYFYQSDFIAYWGAYNSHIAPTDVVVFNEILKNGKNSDKLYLFVKSSGGSGKAALRLIHLLRSVYDEIIVLAPINCASAATMLALGADEIKMGPLSFLTAIDTSITHVLSPVDFNEDLVSVNQNELDRVIKLWNKEKTTTNKNPYEELYRYIHPLVFGAVDRASSLSIRLTSEILSYHMDDKETITVITNHLNSEYPSHGYPITSREAAELGLNVSNLEEEVHEELIQLNHLYSEMAQRSYTDYSEYKYHDNQIYTIIESEGLQMFYQVNRDMVYRREDQQGVPINDRSSWVKVDKDGRRPFFIR